MLWGTLLTGQHTWAQEPRCGPEGMSAACALKPGGGGRETDRDGVRGRAGGERQRGLAGERDLTKCYLSNVDRYSVFNVSFV